MSFEHDIMISYAWKDNQPLPFGDQEGWVSGFHLGLEYWLKQIMPRNPRIWRDKNRMPGNKVFAEELDEVVTKTAVLLTVLSPPYMSSEWCARELDNFVKAAEDQGGLQVENNYRIFKVNKFPVDRKALPDELQPITGFNFYDTDNETREVEVIDPSLGDESKQRFHKRVYDIALVLARFLQQIAEENGKFASDATTEKQAKTPENSSSSGLSSSSSSGASGKVVFIPYSTRDLRDVRADLVAELTRRNCRVLPEQQYALDDIDEFKAAALKDIAAADISIHLIGQRYGTIMEGATQSIIDLQNRWAAEEAQKRDLKRLIWIPRELDDIMDRHADFIQSLHKDRDQLVGADLLADSIENLKSVVLDMLKTKKKVVEAEETGSFNLYLLYDDIDAGAIRPLRKALKDTEINGKELKITRPVFDGEAAELREIHRERLRECDGVMLVWGASSQAWLESALSEVRKAPGFGRAEPYKAPHMVYITGEKTGAKEEWIADFKDDFFEEDIAGMEAYEGVPEAEVMRFLEQLA